MHDLVAFIDDLVARGTEKSRATVVTRALKRERRRELAARDVAILSRTGEDNDMERLAEYVAPLPLDPP